MANSERPQPSLQNIIVQNSLKWIFIVGKGGAGKTTCSVGLGVQLAKVKKDVLIISTDPAHGISDAFDQNFTKVPTLVNGFDNLFAMEIDPNIGLTNLPSEYLEQDETIMNRFFKEILANFPGMNEALSYFEIMKTVKNMKFASIVFDTAPTGNTLRLLSFPELIERGLTKISEFDLMASPVIIHIAGTLGIQDLNSGRYQQKIEEMLSTIKAINQQFRDPVKTTFVCVCIPELLSLYETERLVQEILKHNIDVHNIVINQSLSEGEGQNLCQLCSERRSILETYLKEICELYEDFHITKLPVIPMGIRGIENVKAFSEHLVKPHECS